MSTPPQHYNPHPQNHNRRFYLVMITVILAGILGLLYLNENNDWFSITGASIEDVIKGESDVSTMLVDSFSENVNSETAAVVDQNIPIKLSFNQVPTIQKEVNAEKLDLVFNDLATVIKVNDNKIELNNLAEVKLALNGFVGELNFEGFKVSLKGSAQKIEVNGVAFSSNTENLEISFEGLTYKQFEMINIALSNLELPAGIGHLEVSDKLLYSLTEEEVGLHNFNGNVNVLDVSGEASTEIEGIAGSLLLSGQLLSLSLS